MKAKVLNFIVVTLVAAVLVSTLSVGDNSPSKPGSVMPSLGDARTLRAVYDRWKAVHNRNGGERKLTLGLSYSKALSAQFTRAHGQATLDLVDGSLSVRVSGLSDQEAFDVWLIDNRPGPGRGVKPEPGDVMVRGGSLKHEGETATLQARLAREAMPGFEIDLVVVARAGEAPGAAGLLFGSPSLFQRLYYSELRGQVARLGEAARPPESPGGNLLAAPFRVLIPSPAFADETGGTTDLEALVAEGERVFFNEKFAGNGRTCGTCHPAENNLTIDPKFIATLPNNNPLFVAEFIPALIFGDLENLDAAGRPQPFENPVLMRQFGLILENVDGFDDLPNKFVMRGVPHVLALSTSITPAVVPGFGPDPVDGTTIPPFGGNGCCAERTGWSGDGAPASGDLSGSLRDFAIGAVFQHFTKTLNRMPGIDFRLPTKEELDAMEAFQLSLGRQADLNLSTLILKGAVPELGRQLFLTTAKCNVCHDNAGASIPVGPGPKGNFNFDTGVENLDHPARAIVPFPLDGGFGRTSDRQECHDPPTLPNCRFGNGTFSTPPLVEAADTGPFFHNNAVSTIEEAVDFYNSEQFKTSPAATNPNFGTGPIQLAPDEVQAVAAFLRVLNALQNIRSAIKLGERAEAYRLGKAQELLRLSIAETNDAIKVLEDSELHPGSVRHLRIARVLVEIASTIPFRLIRNIYIRLAIHEQKLARGRMVEG